MTQQEMQQEALGRAQFGQSTRNYGDIFAGFTAKGIPADQINPRTNVFTFHAWKALGRSVRKSEHGVKILTYIESSHATEKTGKDGMPLIETFRRPWHTTVFHISQTDPISAERMVS